MNTQKIKISLFVLLSPLLFIVPTVYAQNYIFNNPVGSKYNNLTQLILGIVDGIIVLMIPIMVLAIVYIGFNIVISKQRPEKYKEHRQHLLWAFIGLFLVLGARGIIAIIDNTIQPILS